MIRIFIYVVFICLIGISAFGQDFSYDKKIGAETAIQVEQMMGSYPDSLLTDYVSQVGNRLAKQLGQIPLEFQFLVVDMPEPNAFALPGGYVYVSRGILGLVNNEDELAGVIGHEMIHVTKRHAVKQMRQGIIPGLLKIPGAIIGGLVNEDLGKIINAPVNFGSAIFLSSYSRKQEREADELGIQLASEAGYDPAKLAGVLESLSAEMENLTGEQEKKSYFSSHPFTPKRVEKINERAPEISWNALPPIAGREELLYILDGMTLGPNPAQGIIEEQVFRHPDLGFAITFPDNWETMNAPVALLAAEPDGNAQVFLIGDDPSLDPDSLGQAFANSLIQKSGIQPEQNKKIEINGYHGYVVQFKDLSGNETVDIQLYWIKTKELLLQVAGIGYTTFSLVNRETVYSLRPLKDEELTNFTVTRIRFATIEENETVESFSERTNNIWDVKTTLLMNGISENDNIEVGELLKIAKKEPYFMK